LNKTFSNGKLTKWQTEEADKILKKFSQTREEVISAIEKLIPGAERISIHAVNTSMGPQVFATIGGERYQTSMSPTSYTGNPAEVALRLYGHYKYNAGLENGMRAGKRIAQSNVLEALGVSVEEVEYKDGYGSTAEQMFLLKNPNP
jgi:hypothetical protein